MGPPPQPLTSLLQLSAPQSPQLCGPVPVPPAGSSCPDPAIVRFPLRPATRPGSPTASPRVSPGPVERGPRCVLGRAGATFWGLVQDGLWDQSPMPVTTRNICVTCRVSVTFPVTSGQPRPKGHWRRPCGGLPSDSACFLTPLGTVGPERKDLGGAELGWLRVQI